MLAVSTNEVSTYYLRMYALDQGSRKGELTAGVGSLEGAGDLSSGRGGGAAATANLDLTTADIPLRGGAGVVDGEGLDAQQVLAAGDTLGDREGVGVCAAVSRTAPVFSDF